MKKHLLIALSPLLAYCCITFAAEDRADTKNHGLVGLRPLPRTERDWKSNHGGNWYATPSTIVLDGSQSSTRADVDIRPPERATLGKGRDEPLKLRIFIDRSVVEVFANGKQYLAMRVYPDRADSIGVSIRAQGQDAVLNKLDAWQMKAIWPTVGPVK